MAPGQGPGVLGPRVLGPRLWGAGVPGQSACRAGQQRRGREVQVPAGEASCGIKVNEIFMNLPIRLAGGQGGMGSR